MFFLKKVFELRDHANPDAEKPFLEHLEDLRVCITRIILTLVIATLVCFFFRHELMTIIRRPVEEVWNTSQKVALDKSKISPEDWEAAKKAADAGFLLKEPEQDALFSYLAKDSANLKENVRAVIIYRAALVIEDKDQQLEFIEGLEGLEGALKAKLLALMEGRPSAEVDARGKLVLMQALKPTEGFMLSIKLSVYAGLVLSFPFLLYFLLQFILPGMHDAERRALWPAMAVGFALFLGGVFFAYFVVLPRVLEFFYSYSADMQIDNVWRIGYYIAFATQFTLIFGLAFELPVVVMTLVKLSILNSEMMRRTRSYAILAIVVIAAIITPTPDALTLMLLAVPMIILYEICIWLAVLLERKARKLEAEEEKERMERLLAHKKRKSEAGEDDDDPDGDGDKPDSGGDTPDGDGDGPHRGGSGGSEPNLDLDHDPEDPHHPSGESGYEHDQYHDEHHDEFHDHDHDHDDFHPEPTGYDPHAGPEPEGPPELGHSHHEPETPQERGEDLEPSGKSELSEAEKKARAEQESFDFHEESDPALTEEGEQEDISDPWPEEERKDAKGKEPGADDRDKD